MNGPSIGRHDRSSPAFHDSSDIKELAGDHRLIVILVEFADIKHQTSRDVLNQMVFTRMANYWREVSYGQFNVIGDTVGWFDMGHEEAYYGKDIDPEDSGSDQRRSQIITDACRQVGGVDFDRYEDIMVVYAGHGQDSDSENENLIWPAAPERSIVCGGKRFQRGAYASELVHEHSLAFGAFTHEFGHTIGLPDLYDYSQRDTDKRDGYVGLWSLMAEGSWAGPSPESNPTGLEAWSRTKLGWLSSPEIPLTSDTIVETLKPIGDASGPRALKLSGKGSIYYMIEVRQKVGVDDYLPDSAVLITQIDESKSSGQGIVKVMNCHPETKTLDHATCKVGESLRDKSESIYVEVIGRQGTSHTVAVANRPIANLNVYTVELSLTGLPSSASATVTIDGIEYGTFSGAETFTIISLVGSSHTVVLSQYITVGNETRYYAGDNTLRITGQGTYTFTYLQQNRLVVESVTGKTEKWLASDETVTVGPYDDLIPVDAGTRYFLVSLNVDGVTQEKAVVKLRMDQPHIVKANYRIQYLLKLDSGFGNPKGGGWYDAEAVAEYSVVSPDGFLIQHVFVSWTGDITSSEPQGTLAMTRSYIIKANWHEDYTQLVLSLVLLAVIVAIVALKTMKQRGSASPLVFREELTASGMTRTQLDSPATCWCILCGCRILQESIFCEYCGARQPDPVIEC